MQKEKAKSISIPQGPVITLGKSKKLDNPIQVFLSDATPTRLYKNPVDMYHYNPFAYSEQDQDISEDGKHLVNPLQVQDGVFNIGQYADAIFKHDAFFYWSS